MQHYHAFYQGNELLLLPVLALLIFAAVFITAALRAWRMNQPVRIQQVSSLPLLDDTAPRTSSGDVHE